MGTRPAICLLPFPSNVLGTVGRQHHHVVQCRMDGFEIGAFGEEGLQWQGERGRKAIGSRKGQGRWELGLPLASR